MESLRAFIIVVVFASIVFHFCRKVLKNDFDMVQFKHFRTIWFTVLTIAFFANNYWLYTVVAGFYVYQMSKREHKLSLYFLLLFIVPPMGQDLPGLGIMDHFFSLDHPRLLALVLLLPFFVSARSTNLIPLGKLHSDKLLILFIILATFLEIRGTTFTDALRRGFSTFFLDMFLPYYFASRVVKSMDDIKRAFTILTIVTFIAALIGLFEWVKHWSMFFALPDMLGAHRFGGYMSRGGSMRAVSSLGHPIVFGLILAASLGAFLVVSNSVKNKRFHKAGMFTILAALFASGSRGPWLGAVFFGSIFSLTGDKPAKRVVYLLATLMLVIGALAVIPGAEKYYNMLPFLGTTEAENVEYRQRLFTNSMIVIGHYPFFGSVTFMETPEMQAMIQGEGIIDIVNTYIGMALNYGYVGAGLFISTFLSIVYAIYANMKRMRDKNGETYYIGRCVLASLISILFTITTVSYILVVPSFNFAIAGIGAAYAEIVRRENLMSRAQNRVV